MTCLICSRNFSLFRRILEAEIMACKGGLVAVRAERCMKLGKFCLDNTYRLQLDEGVFF